MSSPCQRFRTFRCSTFLAGDLAILEGLRGRLAIDVLQYVARLCNVPAPVSTKVPVVIEFRLCVAVAVEVFHWLDCHTAEASGRS